MAKFKAYDYRQRVFLPVSLEEQLMPGTLEFAIHTLVESRLATSGFEQQYRTDETGRTAYDPKIPLKIVLLGYSRGLTPRRSSKPVGRTWSSSPWPVGSSPTTAPSPPWFLPCRMRFCPCFGMSCWSARRWTYSGGPSLPWMASRPTTTATPICGNARNCTLMLISLTSISPAGSPLCGPTAVRASAEKVCLRGFSLRGGHRPLPVSAGQKTQTDSEKSLRRWFGAQNICSRGARLSALPLEDKLDSWGMKPGEGHKLQ